MNATEQVSSLSIGMVLFPNLTQLDFTGPYEVFARLPNTRVYLLAETLEPVRSDRGLAFLPDTTFEEAPTLDMLFVPGGPGINPKLEDAAFLHFLKTKGEQARYVTSVCTGALLLGAAGLLQGYRATTHWRSLEFLKTFGAEPVAERVVIDRNRITGEESRLELTLDWRSRLSYLGRRSLRRFNCGLNTIQHLPSKVVLPKLPLLR
jgi:cyclohexyl-isocyanide hydratase